jgi:hypothetical protein
MSEVTKQPFCADRALRAAPPTRPPQQIITWLFICLKLLLTKAYTFVIMDAVFVKMMRREELQMVEAS